MEAISAQPPERDHQFLEAIRHQAEADATSVAEFVRSAGVQVQQQNGTYEPLGLPPEMLLGLGLAVRLRRWELQGVRLHLEAGIPSSTEVLDRVTSECSGSALFGFVEGIYPKTLQIYRESFLWSGQDCDLNVDLALVAQEDDEFIDAVADFLLSQLEHARHGKITTQ